MVNRVIDKILLDIQRIFFPDKKKYYYCLWCGKELIGSQRKFCSDKCNGFYWRYVEKFGHKPSKKHSKARGMYMDEEQKKKFNTRNLTYRIKKLQGKCYICETKKAMHFHHPDYNEPELAFPLCRKCHARYHSILKHEVKGGNENAKTN